MEKIHLVMPMAGAGSRFNDKGFEVAKPLIEIQNKPFLYWSTMSAKLCMDVKDTTFIVLKEHDEKFDIVNKIIEQFNDSNVVVLDHLLKGCVLTCLEGIKNIKDNNPIVFNDCDHLFTCEDFNKIDKNVDGALLTFESDKDKYSYAALDENGNVVETKEKVVISSHAICGAYYFKDKDTFIKYANEYLKKCSYKEFFMSGVYNEMIKDKKAIKVINCSTHIPFGTPEEYVEANEREFKKVLYAGKRN